jgi:hypothetical protein
VKNLLSIKDLAKLYEATITVAARPFINVVLISFQVLQNTFNNP